MLRIVSSGSLASAFSRDLEGREKSREKVWARGLTDEGSPRILTTVLRTRPPRVVESLCSKHFSLITSYPTSVQNHAAFAVAWTTVEKSGSIPGSRDA